jgi:hypothetical protein
MSPQDSAEKPRRQRTRNEPARRTEHDLVARHGLTSESTFVWSVGFRALEIDDELVLLDSLSDRCFRLNATGTFIWKLVVRARTLKAISEEVASEFEIDEQEAYEVAATFLAQLVDKRLLGTTSEESILYEGT